MCNCYLCGSTDAEIIHRGTRDNPKIDVMKCNRCGLVYLSESMHEIDDFYKYSGMWGGKQVPIEALRNETYEDDYRRFKEIRRITENRVVLDFGCGFGGFLKLVSNSEKKYGIELEDVPREVINREGICCFSSIEDAEANMEEKADVITLFHVLEHLKDPIDILKRLRKMKKPGGRIIIEVPNADDALLSLYDCKEFADFTYWSPHLYLFTNETLRAVAEKAGLNRIYIGQIQRFPLSNTLYWLSKGKPGGHKTWEHLTDTRTDEGYGMKLAEIGMADTIWGEFE